MANYYELAPAYGRDYTTASAAKAAWNAGKDWTGDYQTGFRPINKPQIEIGSTVVLRFSQSRKFVSVVVRDHDTVPEPIKAARTVRPPSVATMTRWLNDGVAKATDGCQVEPDGYCEHGKPSWIIKMGLI